MMGQMHSSKGVTIRDVAKLAGVSISTASRALAGAGGVRPVLEAKILAAATKLSYRPNAAARGLRKARTGTLGIVFNNLQGPGQLDLLKGIGTSCNSAGFGLLSADANGNHKLYLDLIRRFFEQRVEGLFLVSPNELGDALVDYRRNGVPVIALLRKDASAGTAPIVAASEKRATYDAIAELRELGHSEIAYFLRFWDDHRLREVTGAIASVGATASRYSQAFERDIDVAGLAEAIRCALSGSPRPSALVVHSSFLAATLEVIQEGGFRLPRDVSLVSLGSSSWHQILTPGLSAIEADSQAIGRLGCKVMMDWIAGQEPEPAYSELARWARRGSVGARPAVLRTLARPPIPSATTSG
jgi:LacI family transcriptional regulator